MAQKFLTNFTPPGSNESYKFRAGSLFYGETSNSTTAMSVSISGVTEYYTGLTLILKMGAQAAVNCTLNVNGLGAKKMIYGSSSTGTYFASGATYLFVYDGTQFKAIHSYNSDTTYSVVTSAADGLVPKFDAADGTIDSSSTDWVLTNNNGSIGWYKLPANAFKNDNTNYYHTPVYTTGLKIGTGTGVSDMYVPSATGSQSGVVMMHPAANCTTFTSDDSTCTVAAVKKAVTLFTNDYAPTKTGGGASGTWGISITGSAGSVAWANISGKPSAFNPDLPLRLKNYSTSGYASVDEATEQGFHYITGATSRPSFSTNNATDYRVLTTAYSSGWLQQIATDFRCNDIFYRRRENGTWKSWVQIQTTESADARYAKLASPNNLVHTGNEITMIPDAYSGDVYLNYRTASGNTNGAINTYRFCKGNGGDLANVTALSFIGNLSGNAATATKATQDGAGNVITSKYVTLDTAQTISGTKTMTAGLNVSGRCVGGGDDEGIVVGFANNGYAGLCLGGPSQARSVFYFKSDGSNPFWRYNNGSTIYDISHPSKSGTIALTSDLANYLPLSGGTMSGALNFANGTWNNVGDDCALGDCNQAGVIGIKGLNGATGIYFAPYSGSVAQKIFIDGAGTMSITGKVSTETLQTISNGVTSTIGSQNSGWLHYSTNSPNGHWFNASVSVQGNIYAGTNYSDLVLTSANYTSYAATKNHTHDGRYLKLSGGTMSGEIRTSFKSSVAMGSYQAAATTIPDLVEELRYSSGAMGSVNITTAYATSNGGTINAGWYNFIYSPHRSGGSSGAASGDNHNYGTLILSAMTSDDRMWTIRVSGGTIAQSKRVWCSGDSVTGAVWNDYAECRESDCEEFGYVLMEVGDDSLTKTTERLSHFAGVSSDTWGFSQGETARARTPIAVAGRVLVYPYQDRNNYKPGDCVCAAPGGTVDIMTREEVKEWPDRIVGTVSCVPDYEEWGGGESADRDPIKVNGRIWIKVK